MKKIFNETVFTEEKAETAAGNAIGMWCAGMCCLPIPGISASQGIVYAWITAKRPGGHFSDKQGKAKKMFRPIFFNYKKPRKRKSLWGKPRHIYNTAHNGSAVKPYSAN